MKFGKYLKVRRKDAELTQEDLARNLKVSNTYIHQLETGKIDAPTERRCRQLASVLGVSPDELWEIARKERLSRYAERTGLEMDVDDVDKEIINGQVDGEPLNPGEKALVNLYRNLDPETRKEFNSLIVMLFRHIPKKEIQANLREYLRCA